MDQVYSRASGTIVWLGDCNEPFVGPRSELDRRQAGLEDSELWRKQDHQLRSFIAAIHSAEPKWWDRAWTVQEVVVAKSEPIVSYGPYFMPYRELEGLLLSLMNITKLSGTLEGSKDSVKSPDRVALDTIWTLEEAWNMIGRFLERLENIRKLRKLRELGLASLYEAVRLTVGLAADVEQDRVFSLLGMISAEEAQHLPVDYRMSCHSLDMRTMLAAITTHADFYPFMWVDNLGVLTESSTIYSSGLHGDQPHHSWHVNLKDSRALKRIATIARPSSIPWRPSFDTHNSWDGVHSSPPGVLSIYVDVSDGARAALRIHGVAVSNVRTICYQITDGLASVRRKPMPHEQEGLDLLRELRVQLREHYGRQEQLADKDAISAVALKAVEAAEIHETVERLKQVAYVGLAAATEHGIDMSERSMPDTPGYPEYSESSLGRLLMRLIDEPSSNDGAIYAGYYDWESYRGYASGCAVAFCTDDGYIGLGLGSVRPGDVIVLPEGNTPGALALHPEEDAAFFSMKGFVLMEKDTQLPADTSRWFDLV